MDTVNNTTVNATTVDPQSVFGYDVLDNSGNKIGSVDNVWVDDATNNLEFVGVKTGWLFGKIHVIPTENASFDSGNNSITVPYSEDQIKNAPNFGSDDELSPDAENEIYSYYGMDRSTAMSPTGYASNDQNRTMDMNNVDRTNQYDTNYTNVGNFNPNAENVAGNFDTDTENRTIQLAEEELQVGKRQVQAGQVRLRKVVNTEHVSEPIELRHEEIEIERVPVSDGQVGQVGQDVFQEDEIDVPVMSEEPVVNKQARVTGQVQINKNMQTETRTVEGDVRKEDVVLEGDVPDSVDTNNL